MSELDGEVEAAELLSQIVQRPADLALGLSILADVVHELDVRLAAAANQGVLVADLSEEWTGVEIAARAPEVEAVPVEVHGVKRHSPPTPTAPRGWTSEWFVPRTSTSDTTCVPAKMLLG